MADVYRPHYPNANFANIAHIIAKDPLPMLDHFHHRLGAMFKIIDKHKLLGGRIQHFVKRTEYQQRVSCFLVFLDKK